MIPRGALLTFLRLAAAPLLLATIVLQACAPISGPQLSHGSAFSAATDEVAITSQRRPILARLAVAADPFVPPAEPQLLTVERREPAASPARWPGAYALAASNPIHAGARPRAPPAAS
jgi:hypothetical protein